MKKAKHAHHYSLNVDWRKLDSKNKKYGSGVDLVERRRGRGRESKLVCGLVFLHYIDTDYYHKAEKVFDFTSLAHL